MSAGDYRAAATAPRKESAQDAIRRECREELGLTFTGGVEVLDQLTTSLEGKRDHLTIFRGTASSAEFQRNREVAEARWTPLDYSRLPGGRLVSRWADKAIASHRVSRGVDRDGERDRQREP
ncbi:NUDIX hydrolase [Actinoplanes sp. NPDC020271]|uniref:NUDIX hydrolase n=1 Tax=Actinoplanes sp. NPDC020271 TaxID=3363896 RepID=UPI0037AE16FA